jgi:hypothetical protein
MQRRFSAELASRSWGDRLAGKWNFEIPGLPESVEIHMRRLGQTGEQIAIAARLAERARLIVVNDQTFRVTSISDRLMISTLQRMYRHFYFRLCDIVDSAGLVDSGVVDFTDLEKVATNAGIWEGVATYLVIVTCSSTAATASNCPSRSRTPRVSAAKKFSMQRSSSGFRSCRNLPSSMDRSWPDCCASANCRAALDLACCHGSPQQRRLDRRSLEATRVSGKAMVFPE